MRIRCKDTGGAIDPCGSCRSYVQTHAAVACDRSEVQQVLFSRSCPCIGTFSVITLVFRIGVGIRVPPRDGRGGNRLAMRYWLNCNLKFEYAFKSMAVWLPLFLSLMTSQYIADLQVVPLSIDAGAFRKAFNETADRPRVIAIFSPT